MELIRKLMEFGILPIKKVLYFAIKNMPLRWFFAGMEIYKTVDVTTKLIQKGSTPNEERISSYLALLAN